MNIDSLSVRPQHACDQRVSLSVCRSVRLHIKNSTYPCFTRFSVPAAVTRSFCDDNAIGIVLPILLMPSFVHNGWATGNKAILDSRLHPRCHILTNSTKHCSSCLTSHWRTFLYTRNTFYGTRYLSHCYARFALNPLFINWVTI